MNALELRWLPLGEHQRPSKRFGATLATIKGAPPLGETLWPYAGYHLENTAGGVHGQRSVNARSTLVQRLGQHSVNARSTPRFLV